MEGLGKLAPTDGEMFQEVSKSKDEGEILSKDPYERIYQIRKSSTKITGSKKHSTVLLASGDNQAWPTLFPKDKNSFSTNYEDWIHFSDMDEAYEYAKKNHPEEIFTFKTEGEAARFAKGSWKPGGDDPSSPKHEKVAK